jgi:hypothetical protein
VRRKRTIAVICPHCHAVNRVDQGGVTYCSACGHRGDVPRLACDCATCQGGPEQPPLTSAEIEQLYRELGG